MASERVLLVDDEDNFRSVLATTLRSHEYDVKESATGIDAISSIQAFSPRIVLLDLQLPDVDGLTVCRELRAQSDSAIIVLSIVSDERTKIRALDEGADDYLSKPFGGDELLARMRAVLRRSGLRSEEPQSFEADTLKIDFTKQAVFLDGNEVRLTSIEFALLKLLALNPGKLLRHEAILSSVWGEGADSAVLRTYIKRLRAKLGDKYGTPHFIRTEPGLGYRFIEPSS